jgi:hypothetical protein
MLRTSDTGSRSFQAFLLLSFMLAASGTPAWTQTFQVIHYFSNPQGYAPLDGMTADSAGNLYGTTGLGGSLRGLCAAYGGCGTVFRLAPHNSSWIYTPIYNF